MGMCVCESMHGCVCVWCDVCVGVMSTLPRVVELETWVCRQWGECWVCMMMSTVCTHVYVYVCDYAPEYEYLDAYVTDDRGHHMSKNTLVEKAP